MADRNGTRARRRTFVVALVALVALSVASGSAPAAPSNVTVGPGGSLSYDPDPVTIQVGDTVHWVWGSSLHSATSGTCSPNCLPDGGWNSGVLNTGGTFDHQFTQAGTYEYFCSVHTTSMTGTVIVQGTTAVGVSSLAASRSGTSVVVRWRTGAQGRTLGFNVYRDLGGERKRLNEGLILAAGVGSHSFLDRRAPRGQAVYWLQAVRLDGSHVWQGPVLARR